MYNEICYFKKNYIEESCTYTDQFFLKFEGNTYKVYISFCRNGNDFKKQNAKCFLHDAEMKYFKSLVYKRRINSYLLGRYSAKKAVSALIGEDDLRKILIKNGVFNQPVVVCESDRNIQVSLTHCDDLAAAVAFDDMLIIGIDIEKIDSRIKRGLEAELTQFEKELAYRVAYPYDNFLLMLWTMKESLSKCLKTGLTAPLSTLEVKNIEINNGYFLGTYTNFCQYNSVAFVIEDYMCSITYPKNTELSIDINKIIRNIHFGSAKE